MASGQEPTTKTPKKAKGLTPEQWKTVKTVPIRELLNGYPIEDNCPFCEQDGFLISSHGLLWRCKNCSDDRWHSGISILMQQFDIPATEACWLLLRMAGDE